MANKQIKGITVEIGGDTTKLSKALDDVNKKSKSLKDEIREVDRALKLDPTNVVLLSQKQQLLSEAISNTKDKLKTLREAQEQIDEQYKRGDIGAEQYRAFQREIETAEAELRNLESELENVQSEANQTADATEQIGESTEQAADDAEQSMGRAGDAMIEFGGKVEETGEKFIPLTKKIVDVGKAAVTTAADFDSAMSQVAAVSGASGEELEKLRDKAREMGAKTKFSASEAAEAMNYMAMAGWKTQDMLGGIEGIMNLAAASGEDLATTSDIVTDALTAFGLTAADSGHFADILAAASSNANTNVSMMGETFKYAAPVAGALGFSVEDTAEAIGLMANSGIKASSAGTTLRTIMNTLAGEVSICGEQLGKVEIQTSNADGSMRDLNSILEDCREAFSQLSESEAAASAESLVGKNAMSGFLALMNAAPADIKKLEGALNSADGTSLNMAETMQDNLSGQLTILKSQIEEAAISLGEILMPAIRKIISKIQDLTNKFNKLSPATKETIVKIAGIVATIGPVLIIVGKVVTIIGTVINILSTLKTVIMAVNAVLAANPIGIVIAAIAAAIAILVALYNHCEGFRNFVKDMFESWKIGIGIVKDAFVSAWQGIKSAWSATVDFFKGLWDGIKKVFSSVGAFFHDVFLDAYNRIKSVFTGIRDFFVGIWDTIKDVFSSVGTKIGDAFSSAFKAVVNGVFEFVENRINGVFDMINGAIGFINEIPGVNIGTISPISLPRLAKGGVLSEGSAIVAEAGPELLSLLNGKVTVTPLTSDARNTALNGASGNNQKLFYNSYTINATVQGGYDITKIAHELAVEQRRIEMGHGL